MKKSIILITFLMLSSCTQLTIQHGTDSSSAAVPTKVFPSVTPESTATPEDLSTITQVTITLTPPDGYVFKQHPFSSDIPFVFKFDPKVWTFSESNTEAGSPVVDRFSLLEKPSCTISTVLGHGIGPSQRLFYQQFGTRNWLVYEWSMDRSMVEYKELFLDLSGTMDPECKSAQQEFLSNIISIEEFHGGPTAIPYLTPTPRSGLSGFDCDRSLPVLLRVNDTAQVVANSIWLRTEPQRDETTQIRQLLQYSSTLIHVDEGPVCVGGYVYWKVTAMEPGEAGLSISGWMAESDGSEYLLKVFDSGW